MVEGPGERAGGARGNLGLAPNLGLRPAPVAPVKVDEDPGADGH